MRSDLWINFPTLLFQKYVDSEHIHRHCEYWILEVERRRFFLRINEALKKTRKLFHKTVKYKRFSYKKYFFVVLTKDKNYKIPTWTWRYGRSCGWQRFDCFNLKKKWKSFQFSTLCEYLNNRQPSSTHNSNVWYKYR